jgi:hypothetical protein
MGIDPVGVDENNVHSHNRYAYANNNPYKFVDPTGNIAETALDVVSLGLSIAQYNQDPSILNGIGLAYDVVGTAVPFLPAGFGIIRSAGKAGASGVEAAVTANQADNAASAAKKVHGNSLDSTKPAEGYSLRDRDTGEIKKYGETTRGEKRYSKKYLEQNNVKMEFEANGSKREMHGWQHEKILDHKANNGGARPKMNKSDY